MTLWQDVITTALVGTERKPLTPTPATDQLGNLLSRLPQSDPEGALLGTVAALALYQKAGQKPLKTAQPLPTPCPGDTLSPCSPRAAQHLQLMLQKEWAELLPEWLAAAATSGKRAPDSCLPKLLELGRTSRHLRPGVVAILGRRGRWLAAQNPNWDYGVGEETEEIWQNGSIKARQLLLQRLRQDNPDAARERLAAVWEQEKSDARLALIETLQIGLSMADEPFLEAALSDRRKEVRRQAAESLAQLPQSRLCQRMRARVQPLVRLKQKRQRLHLDFSLPDTDQDEISRDGIETKQPPRLLGPKDWILLQMVAATPLSVWDDLNGEPPNEWVQAAKRSEWDRPLVDGWAVAAVRQKNVQWAEALLAVHDSFNGYLISQNQLIHGLLGVFSPAEREAFFLRLFESNDIPLDSKHPAFPLLRHCRYPWSVELTRRFFEGVRRYLAHTENPYDWSLRSALMDCAYVMNCSLIPELSTALPTFVPQASSFASYWIEAIDELFAILNFRVEMLREF